MQDTKRTTRLLLTGSQRFCVERGRWTRKQGTGRSGAGRSPQDPGVTCPVCLCARLTCVSIGHGVVDACQPGMQRWNCRCGFPIKRSSLMVQTGRPQHKTIVMFTMMRGAWTGDLYICFFGHFRSAKSSMQALIRHRVPFSHWSRNLKILVSGHFQFNLKWPDSHSPAL